MATISKADAIELAKTTAVTAGLSPAIVCGVCERESSWFQYSLRYEPAFEAKYLKKLKLTDATEQNLRATSFGLMQILGQVARELGYSGPLGGLCEPALGIKYGCAKLAAALKKAKGDYTAALLAYNGGANAQYAAEVLAFSKKY